jgi:sugar O-acyltransferase (sialic acid O-acetyltransferase NeuD family)
MLADALVKKYGIDIKVRIIRNIEVENTGDIPFIPPGVQHEIIWHDEWKNPAKDILMGVGSSDSREAVYDFFSKKYHINSGDYTSIIHPFLDISITATMGSGVFCNSGTSIAPFVSIGNLVVINRQVGIGHHTRISDFCIINPNVNIAGYCHIGKNSVIGLGANILDGISIGKNTIIGAGSLVTKNIPDNIVAYGSPAKKVRDNQI